MSNPKANQTVLRMLCRNLTRTAIEVLNEIMQDPRQNGQIRIAAATAILDRGYGKPTQSVAIEHSDESNPKMMTTEELRERLIQERAERMGVYIEGKAESVSEAKIDGSVAMVESKEIS